MPHLRQALLPLAAVALLAGCGSTTPPPLPTRAAPPQRADLGWVERYPEDGPAFVFETKTFEVTPSGWRAVVRIENGTSVPWTIAGVASSALGSFGVMLFTTDDVSEVEERSRDDSLPGLRQAQSFTPPLPVRLAPGASWSGTVAAPGTLAAGLFVRLVFGPFVTADDPPDGMQQQFSWITDGSYHLKAGSAR